MTVGNPRFDRDPEIALNGGGGVKSWVRAAIREPFFHFLLLGAFIFAVAGSLDRAGDRYSIEVGPAQLQRITATYQQQFGTVPTESQLAELVRNHVRDEILFREGRALGLAEDDEIVRRRVIQKYQFLQQDLALERQPGDGELREYYSRHRDRYARSAARNFTHVYFSPDRDGEEGAKRRAEAALEALTARGLSRGPEYGDAFPGPTDNVLNETDAARLFGEPGIARAIFTVPLGRWSGPFRSGYGWHLVQVTSEAPAAPRPLGEVLEIVRADLVREERERRNQAALDALMAKYQVRVEGGDALAVD